MGMECVRRSRVSNDEKSARDGLYEGVIGFGYGRMLPAPMPGLRITEYTPRRGTGPITAAAVLSRIHQLCRLRIARSWGLWEIAAVRGGKPTSSDWHFVIKPSVAGLGGGLVGAVPLRTRLASRTLMVKRKDMVKVGLETGVVFGAFHK